MELRGDVPFANLLIPAREIASGVERNEFSREEATPRPRQHKQKYGGRWRNGKGERERDICIAERNRKGKG